MKEVVDLFEGVQTCNFYIKNKLKPKTFNDKKKMFFSVITENSNWDVLTNNLVILKAKIALTMKNFRAY